MTTSAIWDSYADDVRRFILSRVGNESQADDLLQDVFTKIHLKADQLRDDSRMKSWIFTIARNTVYDFLKKNRFEEELPQELPDEVTEEKNTHTEKDCLPGIIRSLPKKYRDLLFLSDIKGIKQTALAEQFDLPLPTVKSRIQRARKMISQSYMDCCDYKLNAEGKLVGEIKEKENCKMCNH
ncbi:sigma-70 family RNA polymerase sigma factor [Leptobacterium flavescens]|uniref:Sigma-70 family RNA polymerase sigma factor n=1 Tax=Leptobacterium flavescens TaxID=472055 RepID=A0A6P0UQ07_9FLAO|nr:sigma-70 family RNA polymerase sigma factor [Leptobacterium flavescens]NER15434.1 sigma-70 family RNA polymerase sigma factor [Leptobacterium flavescens]